MSGRCASFPHGSSLSPCMNNRQQKNRRSGQATPLGSLEDEERPQVTATSSKRMSRTPTLVFNHPATAGFVSPGREKLLSQAVFPAEAGGRI